MKRIAHTGLLAILLLLIGIGVPKTAESQVSHEIRLAGHKSVPPVGTRASGKITVTVRHDTLIVSGTFRELMGQYHSGGVFVGEEDENGNRLFQLEVNLNEEKTGGSFAAEDNRFPLRELHKTYLSAGEFYISISSYEYRRGEIRAQIPAVSFETDQ